MEFCPGLALLDPVKKQFGDTLSWSDLIVLSGTVALEQAGVPKMEFCPGRTDATGEDAVSEILEYLNKEPAVEGKIEASVDDMQEYSLILGLTPREFTALMGRHALGTTQGQFSGKWVSNPSKLSSEYFHNLLIKSWAVTKDGAQYEAGNLRVLRTDVLLTADPEFLAAVQDFAADEQRFLSEFAGAWTKMMNADRFDGPTGNVCNSKKPSSETKTGGAVGQCSADGETTGQEFAAIGGITVLFGLLLFLAVKK